MSFKEEMEAALEAYDAAKEERSALVGKEATDEVNAKVSEVEARMTKLAAEVSNLSAKAEEERAIEEARSKSPLYTPRARTEARSEADELRSALNGDGRVFEFRSAITAGGVSNYANGSFVEKVVTAVKDNTSVLKAGAFILTDSTGNRISAPSVTGFGPAQTAESTALPETASGTVKHLSHYNYGGLFRLSNALIRDVNADLVGLLGRRGGVEVANALNAKLLTGTGSSQPEGATVGGSLGSSAAAASITVADVYDLFYSLEQAADRGTWIMSGATATAIRLADTNGQLWATSPAGDNPQVLLGRPVIIDSNMPAIGASAKSVLFGDFENGYLVRMVGGVEVTASEHYYFNSNDTAVRVQVSADGLVTDSNLIKYLQHAAS